jgi:hypothetical protein
MSVVRGRPEVALRIRQIRVCPHNGHFGRHLLISENVCGAADRFTAIRISALVSRFMVTVCHTVRRGSF